MKPISPVRSYDGEATYPKAGGSSRREVLGTLAAGLGAAVGTMARAWPAEARGGRYHRVTLPLSRRHYFDQCEYVLDSLDLQTPDASLATFLADQRERAGLQKAAEGALRGTGCTDVTDRRRLAALERRLGIALVEKYRARTRRRAAAPIVTLSVTKHRPPVPGGLRPPSHPVPSP